MRQTPKRAQKQMREAKRDFNAILKYSHKLNFAKFFNVLCCWNIYFFAKCKQVLTFFFSCCSSIKARIVECMADGGSVSFLSPELWISAAPLQLTWLFWLLLWGNVFFLFRWKTVKFVVVLYV